MPTDLGVDDNKPDQHQARWEANVDCQYCDDPNESGIRKVGVMQLNLVSHEIYQGIVEGNGGHK